MSRIEIPPKIRTEDFPSEMSETIGKLAGIYNNFVDQVYQALNGQIDYTNLKRQITTFTVNVNAAGQITNLPTVKYNLVGRLLGITTLSVTGAKFPTSSPFISWTINGNLVTVLNITGLSPNSTYTLTVELISN